MHVFEESKDWRGSTGAIDTAIVGEIVSIGIARTRGRRAPRRTGRGIENSQRARGGRRLPQRSARLGVATRGRAAGERLQRKNKTTQGK